MCLQWIEENAIALAGQQVLDYGCGSGILAIAAMKFGAAGSLGIDIDPVALPAARVKTHGSTASMSSSVTRTMSWAIQPVFFWPIFWPIPKALAPALARHTRSDGHLVLAGLLDEQADELIDIYAPWFDRKDGGLPKGGLVTSRKTARLSAAAILVPCF